MQPALMKYAEGLSGDEAQEVIDRGIENYIFDIYYEEHNCGFWECLKKESNSFVLVSQKAKEYWNVLFYWSLLASALLLTLLFVFSTSKNSPLIITGMLMMVTALPFRKITWILKFIPDSPILDLIAAFFLKSYNVFIIMIIIGAILFGIGMAFDLFGLSMNISGFFSKLFRKEKKGETSLTEEVEKDSTKEDVDNSNKEEVKNIVKEEVSDLSKEEVKDMIQEEVEKAKTKEKLRKHVKKLVKEELNKSDKK